MAETCFACRPCNLSDPTKDTVKVDVSRLGVAGKENVMPSAGRQAQERIAAEAQKREEDRRIAQLAEECRKREQADIAAKAAKEEERFRQEELARKEAEKERLRQEAEAERLRQEAEERLRQEAEEERLNHERQEAAELEAAEQANKRIAEQQAAQKKAALWCKTHGFSDVHTPKTTMRGNKKYALHTAVKHEDCDAVKMLLLCGANEMAKDSKGLTALQVAEKIKPGKTREAILAALR